MQDHATLYVVMACDAILTVTFAALWFKAKGALRTAVRQRDQLDRQLEQAGRVASLGRLAATIAHEFNNVLMAISISVDVLRRDNLSAERRSMAIERITAAIERAKRITGEILRFTRPADAALALVNVGALLTDFAAEARSLLKSDQEIRVEAPESLFVNGDRNLLHQVLTNLVMNARDALEGAGMIVIGARHEQRYVHLFVSDTGAGMTPDVLEQVFEPLFTTKRSGTGLGLAVVHQIVIRHGGQISVQSTPGVGTTFDILLPFAEPPC